jgi:nucleoside-diphosphate-sugar epimerase
MPGRPICLVTGAAGFIGSRLVHRLVGLGWLVVGTDRVTVPAERRCPDVRYVSIDLCDLPGTCALITDVRPQVVFHLSAQPLVPDSIAAPYPTVLDNVLGTAALLEAVRVSGDVTRVVHASSAAVYGADPGSQTYSEGSRLSISPNLYGPSKIAAENLALGYVATYGMDVRICRFMNVYGPGDTSVSRIVPTAIRLALRGLPYHFGKRDDGSTCLDFVYVDDVVNGYLAAAMVTDDQHGAVYNFGATTPISLLHLVGLISRLVDGRERVAVFSGDRALSPRIKHLDFARTTAALGWTPQTHLASGLTRTVAWYRSDGDPGD